MDFGDFRHQGLRQYMARTRPSKSFWMHPSRPGQVETRPRSYENFQKSKNLQTSTISRKKHEIFRFFFAELSKFFQFSEVFVASGTCFDLSGPARMHSDAIGCIRKRSDGRVRAIYRRSPWCRKSPKSAKCALSRPDITTGIAGKQ